MQVGNNVIERFLNFLEKNVWKVHSHNASETKLIVYHQFTTKKFLSESIKEKEADLVS